MITNLIILNSSGKNVYSGMNVYEYIDPMYKRFLAVTKFLFICAIIIEYGNLHCKQKMMHQEELFN